MSGIPTEIDVSIDMANEAEAATKQRQQQEAEGAPVRSRRLHGVSDDHDGGGTLLVVATLITTLSYQVGSNVPSGYWQDTLAPAKTGEAGGGFHPGHRAGDPIMRDEHHGRYMLFMASSWVGFASSMLLTLGLLTGAAPGSRFVRWLFVVSYSTLVLTFIASQVHTVVWADLVLWAAVITTLASAVSYRRLSRLLIQSLRGKTTTPSPQLPI